MKKYIVIIALAFAGCTTPSFYSRTETTVETTTVTVRAISPERMKAIKAADAEAQEAARSIVFPPLTR